MTKPEHQIWLLEALGVDSLSNEDATEPFTLLQALSLASPSSVDLSWYASDEAFNCEDLPAKTLNDLKSGLLAAAIHVDDDIWRNVTDRDAKGCDELLNLIWGGRDTVRPRTAAVAVSRKVSVTAKEQNGAPVGSSMVIDDTEDDFAPSESAFIPAVRWLLALIKQQPNLSANCKTEITDLLASLSNTACKTLPPKAIRALCAGTAYQLACDSFLGSRMETTVETVLPEKGFPECFFLDALTNHGYLNIPKRLCQNVREMIADHCPFYESIHTNILEALMATSWKDLKVDSMVRELKNFETFDPTCMYPYDVPDALHAWTHQIIMSLIRRITNNTSPDSKLSSLLESTDLLSVAQDGRAVGAIFAYYFEIDCDLGGLHLETMLKESQIVANWEKIRKWARKLNVSSPPWFGESMASWEGSSSEAFRGLITMYFATLYKRTVCVGDSLEDPMKGRRLSISAKSSSERSMDESISRVMTQSTSHRASTTTASIMSSSIPTSALSSNKAADTKTSVSLKKTTPPKAPTPSKASAPSVKPTTPTAQSQIPASTTQTTESSSRRLKLRDRGREPVIATTQAVSLPPIPAPKPTQSTPTAPVPLNASSSTISLPPIAGAAEPSDKVSGWRSTDQIAPIVVRRVQVPEMIDLPSQVFEKKVDKMDFIGDSIIPEVLPPKEFQRVAAAARPIEQDIVEDLIESTEQLPPSVEHVPETIVDDDIESELVADDTTSLEIQELQHPAPVPVMDITDEIMEDSHEGDEIIVHRNLAHLLGDDEEPEQAPIQEEPLVAEEAVDDDGWRMQDEVDHMSTGDYYDIPSAPSSPSQSPPHPHIASFSLSEALDAQNRGQSSERKGGVAFVVDLSEKEETRQSTFSRRNQTPAAVIAPRPEPARSETPVQKRFARLEAQKSKVAEQQQQRKEAQERELAEQRRVKEEEEKKRLEERAKKRVKESERPSKVDAPASRAQSNRILIRNALTHLCLAGAVNGKMKDQILEDLDSHPGTHFLILFPPPESRTFRGLYTYDPNLDTVHRVSVSKGPDKLDPKDIAAYYKYDSGARDFKRIEGCCGFGRSVHAVALSQDFAQGNKKRILNGV
ncbi:hypothetical protein SmJEL517_g01630 [Synchytrium microbalum]|uniref:CKK domain-containing protein n=1 Tax=Synchytrium microbalum TaxID=1806994 RepID=A0A507CEJ2_9FUNG|nr:uncharacterized protein SmJEL517_g01630 [Synchytrium microbalum]TPX36324.1 hypothetical protein SmJEL517_g01630 [Synchytrium microbalum]